MMCPNTTTGPTQCDIHGVVGVCLIDGKIVCSTCHDAPPAKNLSIGPTGPYGHGSPPWVAPVRSTQPDFDCPQGCGQITWVHKHCEKDPKHTMGMGYTECQQCAEEIGWIGKGFCMCSECDHENHDRPTVINVGVDQEGYTWSFCADGLRKLLQKLEGESQC